MSSDSVVRVRYYDGQYLRRQDFTTEQDYQIGMRRRHNVANHSWGIVDGLALEIRDGELALAPGLAVDGFGREVVVTSCRTLPPESFDEEEGPVFDVWLLYDKEAADPAPPGWTCPEDRGKSQYRWLEIPKVEVRAVADPRRPPPARQPPGSEVFPYPGPFQTPPDDPAARWPVFLGRVVRTPDAEAPYRVSKAHRPYAGLVGNEFRRSDEAGSTVRVALEASTERRPGRFAVHLPAAAGQEVTPLTVDAEDGVTVDGNLNVEGDVTVAGAVDFRLGNAIVEAAPPDGGREEDFRLYLVDPGSAGPELRLEMPGTEPRRVVIGSWSEDEEVFVPALVVGNDRTVRIPGELVVEGRLVRGQESAPADEEAEGALLGSFLSGLESGGVLPEPVLRALAVLLAGDPERLQQFLCQLKVAMEERGERWPPYYICDPCQPQNYGPGYNPCEESDDFKKRSLKNPAAKDSPDQDPRLPDGWKLGEV